MPKDALSRRRDRRPSGFCQEQTDVLTEEFSSMEAVPLACIFVRIWLVLLVERFDVHSYDVVCLQCCSVVFLQNPENQ